MSDVRFARVSDRVSADATTVVSVINNYYFIIIVISGARPLRETHERYYHGRTVSIFAVVLRPDGEPYAAVPVCPAGRRTSGSARNRFDLSVAAPARRAERSDGLKISE